MCRRGGRLLARAGLRLVVFAERAGSPPAAAGWTRRRTGRPAGGTCRCRRAGPPALPGVGLGFAFCVRRGGPSRRARAFLWWYGGNSPLVARCPGPAWRRKGWHVITRAFRWKQSVEEKSRLLRTLEHGNSRGGTVDRSNSDSRNARGLWRRLRHTRPAGGRESRSQADCLSRHISSGQPRAGSGGPTEHYAIAVVSRADSHRMLCTVPGPNRDRGPGAGHGGAARRSAIRPHRSRISQ